MPSIHSSRIPGERVSKEAQKIQNQNKEALKNALDSMQQAADGTSPVAAGAAAVAGAAAAGIAVGGILGGLMGGILKLPNQQTYKIQPGDNLDSIAKKQLGPKATGNELEKYMNKILDLNKDIIKNPHELYKGDTIALPEHKASGSAAPAQKFVED